MDPGSERFREVWGNTQDNLETAVGTAYSSWTDFQRAYLTPAYKSASSCLSHTVQNGLVCCFGSRMAARGNYYNSSRRDSFDIFYDMYDDEVYGRDELERLLSAHDDDVVFGGLADESDYGDGDGGQAIRSERSKRRASRKGKGVQTENYLGEEESGDMVETNNAPSQQGGSRYFQHGMAVEPPIDSQAGLFNNSKTRLASFFHSIFPTKKPAHPGTTAAAAARAPNRNRSSTKSSTQSSETFRSRAELFSDDADSALLEDAQMMSDNFAASLVYKSGAESTKSISGEDEGDGSKRASSLHETAELHFDDPEAAPAITPTLDSRVETRGKPLTDEELRQEEEALAREEEAHIASKRRAAKAKAKSLGLVHPAKAEDQEEEDEEMEQPDTLKPQLKPQLSVES